MYPLGHYGLALILAAPVAYVLGRRAGTVFAMFVLVTALLPDLDLVIPGLEHHGLTHTVAFVVLTPPVIGVLVTVIYGLYRSTRGDARHPILDVPRVLVWATLGSFLGLASHLLADLLLVVPVTPISPLAPFDDRVVVFDVFRVGNVWRNLSLFALGLALNIVAFWGTDANERASGRGSRSD